MSKHVFSIICFFFYFASIPLFATSYTFIATNGDWNDSNNWEPKAIPTSSDHVIILVDKSATIGASITVSSMDLRGAVRGTGTLNVTGNLKITGGGGILNDGVVTVGSLDWASGTIGKTVTTTVTDFIVQGNAVFSLNLKSLISRKLILQSGGEWTGGEIAMTNAAILEIPMNQTFTLNATTNWILRRADGSALALNVNGTLLKKGAGYVTINVPINHTGLIRSDEGQLAFDEKSNSTGTFTSNAVAGIYFYSGTYTFQLGSTFTGIGGIKLGNMSRATTLNSTGGSFTSTVAQLEIENGTYNFDGTFQHTGALTMTGGVFAPIGTTTIGGNLTWGAGYIGTATLPSVSEMTVAGFARLGTAVNFSSEKPLFKKKLILNGGGEWSAGRIYMANDAILQIPENQTLLFTGNSRNIDKGDASAVALNIYGTLLSQATGTLDINVPVNHIGLIRSNAGTIALSGGSTSIGTFNSNTANGIYFFKGTHTLQLGSTFTGTGSIRLGSVNAAMTLNATGGSFTSTVAQLEIASGTNNFDGAFQHTGNFVMTGGIFAPVGNAQLESLFRWSGGNIGTIGATLVVNSNGAANITGGTLISKKLCLNGNIIALTGLTLSNGGTVQICYAPVVTVTNPSCGQTTGSLMVSTKTGLEYALNNSSNYQTNGVFSGLIPGNYTIKARIIGTIYLSEIQQATIESPSTVVPSVSITSDAVGAICLGTSVQFTATPTQGGTTPQYQWQKNGQNIGSNSNLYIDNQLVNSDVIRCILTPSIEVCAAPATATSNAITITLLTPTIVFNNCPSSSIQVTTNCGQNTATASWNAPTISSTCGIASLSSNYTSGSTFPVGSTTVTYTAVLNGITATCNFDVIVTASTTAEPLLIGCPTADLLVTAACGQPTAIATWATIMAQATCGNEVPTLTTSHPSGTTFPIGETLVTYTATLHNKITTCQFKVIVTAMPQILNLVCPSNVIIRTGCGQTNAIATWIAPIATLSCGMGVPTVSGSHVSGSSFAVGSTTVTYMATFGNTTQSCSFNVYVIADNNSNGTPPTFDPSKCYHLVNRKSNQFIEVYQSSTANQAPIVQHSLTNGNHQQWQIANAENGFIQLKARHSNKTITTLNNGNNTNLYQMCYTAQNGQHWKIECLGNGYYAIRHRQANKYWSIEGSSVAENARLEIRVGKNMLDQQWQIVETTCGIPSSASCPNGFKKETDVETLSMALNIFPQPAQTQMNIQLQPYLEGSINVSILNIFGQSVLTVESNGSDNLNLDVSSIPSGVYLVQLAQHGKRIKSKEIVIQR